MLKVTLGFFLLLTIKYERRERERLKKLLLNIKKTEITRFEKKFSVQDSPSFLRKAFREEYI